MHCFPMNQESRSPSAVVFNILWLDMTKWQVLQWIRRCLNSWQDSINQLSPVDYHMLCFSKNSKVSQQLTGFKIFKRIAFQRTKPCGSPNAMFFVILSCLISWQDSRSPDPLFFQWSEPCGSPNGLIFIESRGVLTADRTHDLQMLCFQMNWAPPQGRKA